MSIGSLFVVNLCLMLSPAADPSSAPPLVARAYRIRLWLRFADHPRLSPPLRDQVLREVPALVEQFMGAAWELEVVEPPESLLISETPNDDVLQAQGADLDKILWLEVGSSIKAIDAALPTIPVAVREYDYQFQQWGTTYHERLAPDARLPLRLLQLLHRQFRPTLVVAGLEKDGSIGVAPRALWLQPVNTPMPLTRKGLPFRVFREFLKEGERFRLLEIPYTYLRYTAVAETRLSASCELVTALRNPLTGRSALRSQIIGIASATREDASSVVQFTTGEDKQPVIGFDVGVQPLGQSAIISIGSTNRRGEITVRPVQLANQATTESGPILVNVVLRTGRVYLAKFPLVPGDRDWLRVSVSVDPLLTEISGRILHLQEEVVDVVARSTLLNVRLEHYQGNSEIAKAQDVARQINELPDKSHFVKEFEEIKAIAEKRRRTGKRDKLGLAIERLFRQTDYLLSEKVNLRKVQIEIQQAGTDEAAAPTAETGAAAASSASANASPSGSVAGEQSANRQQ